MIILALKEAVKSIGRAKLAFWFSLFSVSIGLLLISISLFILFFSHIIEEKIIESFKVNAYLNEEVSPLNLTIIQQEFTSKSFCKKVEYISKEKAKQFFIEETGNDFTDVLEYNPLPASFVITIKKEYFNESSLDSIKSYFSNHPNIDSFDFENRFLIEVKSIIENIKIYFWICTIMLLIIAMYIVYSTMRLIIENKGDEIQTMKLVGASKFTIKLPILFTGLFIGIFASIFMFFIFLIVYLMFKDELSIIIISYNYLLLAIIGATLIVGPLKGLIISWLSVKSISFKVK